MGYVSMAIYCNYFHHSRGKTKLYFQKNLLEELILMAVFLKVTRV